MTKSRGVLLPWPGSAYQPELFTHDEDGAHTGVALATIHPSAVLRADDREAAYSGLVADLKVAAEALAG